MQKNIIGTCFNNEESNIVKEIGNPVIEEEPKEPIKAEDFNYENPNKIPCTD